MKRPFARTRPHGLAFMGLGVLGLAAAVAADEPSGPALPPAARTPVDFARDIRPILAGSCVSCHGPQQQKAGLRLDRKADARAGGDSGPPLEPGHGAESLLIEKVAGLDPLSVMPPKGQRLSAVQIGLLRAWIDQGAVWPDGADLSPAEDRTSDHWAFQPPRRPSPPAVRSRDGVRNPIDAFILARLGGLDIAPAPEADRTTLIRRLSLDLLGLPPRPDEVDAFVQDEGAGAYEKLVDRLLASPHFGERWGRHWLDLARYADSDGYEKDSPRPHAWRFRNWVIDAINRDLPFDQFTLEQLAGDLLPQATPEQKTATGFHRNTLTNREGGVDAEEFRVAAVVDRVNTTGTVWLGLTVGCAQCHTHKYDPILHKEYYGLFAFFNSGQEVDLPAPLLGEIESLSRAAASPAPASKVQALVEHPNPPKTYIHIRGDFRRKGDEVRPGVLAVLPPLKPAGSTPDRLDLARWLVDPGHPLTARVTVNRVWGHLFGRPLTVSVDDFGTRGERPSHPELLDWLATEFIARGWSRKALIRTIVTSATYRQASRTRPELLDRDPNNVWLARQGRMRLEAEVLRDVALAAGGLLVRTVGGPSVRPPQPPGISELTYAGSAKWVESAGPDRHRRGLYTWFQRTSPYPMLMTFDAPDSNVCAVRRERSNTPLQALTLLNDPTFVECARALGHRMIVESASGGVAGRIRHAFRLCVAREPSPEERAVLVRLFETLIAQCRADPEAAAQLVGAVRPAGADLPETAACIALARTILNLDEFVTRE